MAARLIAVGLLVATLAIALGFVAMVLIGPREKPRTVQVGGGSTFSAPAEHVFSGDLGRWRLQGELAISATGAYRLSFGLSDDPGNPAPASTAPSVQVDMVDHQMEPMIPQIESLAPGAYQAAGTLGVEGRWRFRISLEEEAIGVVADFRR